MLLCRAGRLSCAALGPARTAPGFLLLHGPGHVTSLTAPVGRHLHRCRFLCGSVVETRAHPNRQKAELKWGTRLGFVTAEWRPLNRARTEAARLSGGEFDRGRATGGLFTGNWGVFCRRPFTTSMQSRSSSTKQSAEPLDSSKKDTSTSTPEKSPEEMPESEEPKPNKTQQLKKVFKEYGAVGVSFHIGMSLMSLGMFYLLVSSGIDMAAILCKVGFSEAVVQSKMAAGTSTFVLAYAIHKLFAPVRISITLVSVPLIVRYLRKTGLFKPPTPAP
ncbi:protein FAM210B, mitochondrial [Oryzias latipes]|uniref:Family with sequence similarity 210 member B n=1 Tax=Oryzias latipes TaxID=8090 RepID=A0A3B3I854_ORYLA|nr:protein FAM210B, mitochondrial [Oryzias latipes]